MRSIGSVFFSPTTTCATVLSAVYSGVCGLVVIVGNRRAAVFIYCALSLFATISLRRITMNNKNKEGNKQTYKDIYGDLKYLLQAYFAIFDATEQQRNFSKVNV